MILSFFFELLRSRRAATAVEYGLILALIFLAMVVGLRAMSTETGGLYDRINNKFEAVR